MRLVAKVEAGQLGGRGTGSAEGPARTFMKTVGIPQVSAAGTVYAAAVSPTELRPE